MSEVLNYDDVADMFKDKNLQIFSDNVSRNVSDNDSSLRLTVSNKISLITTEILRKINESFKQAGTQYDFKTLNELFSKYSTTLTDFSFMFLDERKNEVMSAFLVDTSTIDGIVAVLDHFLDEKKDSFERGINDIIYSQLEGELFETFQFSDEQHQQQVLLYLGKYDSKITGAVESSVVERNSSLKNSLHETYTKVENLNNMTFEISTSKNKV